MRKKKEYHSIETVLPTFLLLKINPSFVFYNCTQHPPPDAPTPEKIRKHHSGLRQCKNVHLLLTATNSHFILYSLFCYLLFSFKRIIHIDVLSEKKLKRFTEQM